MKPTLWEHGNLGECKRQVGSSVVIIDSNFFLFYFLTVGDPF